MKSICKFLVGATVVLGLLGFVVTAQAGQLTQIKTAGVLKCGVAAGYEPFSFVGDSGSRKLVGYDVDICHAIADHIGVKPELVFVTGGTRIPDLVQGRTDIALANLTHNAQRAKVVDFSYNYLASSVKVAVRASSDAHTFADLAGKKISGTAGIGIQAKIDRKIDNAKVHVFQSLANAFLALKQGKVAAMAADYTSLRGLIGDKTDKFRLLEQPLDIQQIGIGIRKGSGELKQAVNDTLIQLEKSGKAQEIFDRWFGKNSPLKLKRDFKFAPYQASAEDKVE